MIARRTCTVDVTVVNVLYVIVTTLTSNIRVRMMLLPCLICEFVICKFVICEF